jgi:hypothetical protein
VAAGHGRQGCSTLIIYLLHFAQENAALDDYVGEPIEKDEYFFSLSLRSAYPRGNHGLKVRASLDYRLERTSEHSMMTLLPVHHA